MFANTMPSLLAVLMNRLYFAVAIHNRCVDFFSVERFSYQCVDYKNCTRFAVTIKDRARDAYKTQSSKTYE
jgi:hypothetical protein